MTGNVSIFSDRIASGRFLAAGFYIGIVLIFICGSLSSTLIINAGFRRESRVIYAVNILIEGRLMALLAAVVVLMPVEPPTTLLVFGSGFLMGWQNAVVTRISGARVRTTHVSGMITDIGIELALGLELMFGRKVPDDRIANAAKLLLHSWTVAAFIGGGLVGVLFFQPIHGCLYLFAASILVTMAFDALAGTKRSGLPDEQNSAQSASNGD